MEHDLVICNCYLVVVSGTGCYGMLKMTGCIGLCSPPFVLVNASLVCMATQERAHTQYEVPTILEDIAQMVHR